MSDDAGPGLLERARDAAARNDWRQAFDLFMEADAGGLLAPTDLPVLGEVAYAGGHVDVTIEAWERAHAASMRAGDQVAAAGAAVRVAMHLLFDTALMAPVRGWLARAERLLEGRDETPAHAWFAVVRTYERMLTGDLPGARPWAWRAIEVGSTCDPAARAIGQVAEARLRILDGDVPQGLALLGQAGWRRSPETWIRSRQGSSTANSYAPCRASRTMTWPRNGPRRWSGSARRMPLGASTDAAGSTAPRSSGSAGPATRRNIRRSWPARNCAPICDASSAGR